MAWVVRVIDDSTHAAVRRLPHYSDESAWGDFMRPYLQAAYRIALHCNLQTADAEDVCQDLARKVLQEQKDGSLISVRSFAPWFYKVAWNLVHDVWRRQRKQRRDQPGLELSVPSCLPSPYEYAACRDDYAKLCACLENLELHDGLLLKLRHWTELSPRETAAWLGMPPRTVLRHTERARTRLRLRFSDKSWPSRGRADV